MDFFQYREKLAEASNYDVEPDLSKAEKNKLARVAEFPEEGSDPDDLESKYGKMKRVAVPSDLRNTSLRIWQAPKALVVYAYESGGPNPHFSEASVVFPNYRLPGGKKGDDIKRWLFWAVGIAVTGEDPLELM